MVNKVGMEQIFLRVGRFSPVSIIPPVFHTFFTHPQTTLPTLYDRGN